MANEKDLNDRVNPTSNTAITTLMMLANADYEQAAAILEKMGIKKEMVFREVNSEDMINRPSDIVRELRYVALNRTIEESGFDTLMDLPCGYTPKVFEFTDKGMHYIGCDLPAVINDFAPIIYSMADDEQRKKIDFSIVDVTNYESMKAAADKADGPLCIATEGLTIYLTPDEVNLLKKNVKSILSEKGGCWLNTDVETLEYYMAVFKAVAGDRAWELMAAAKRGFSGQSDTDFNKNTSEFVSRKKEAKGEIRKVDYEKIEKSYTMDGLKVEKIPYYRDDIDLHLFDKMSSEEIKKLKENMKHVNIWKITLDPACTDKSADPSEKSGTAPEQGDMNLPFEIKTTLEDGVLTASIQGRMDTITAPELLKQFEEAGDGIEAINVDVSRMAYVSSAGLRVLLIMYKSLENKDNFNMTGVNADVREILETTGFDQFLLKE